MYIFFISLKLHLFGTKCLGPMCPKEVKSTVFFFCRYLGDGLTFKTISQSMNIDKGTTKEIILDCCEGISTALQALLDLPSHEKWLRIRNNFQLDHGFPLCVGALDGYPIPLKKNKSLASVKSCFQGIVEESAIMYVLVDSMCKFTMVDFCGPENTSFSDTGMGQALHNNQLNIPEPENFLCLPLLLPSVVCAPVQVNLTEYVLTPFKNQQTISHFGKTYFNRRHEKVLKCASIALNVFEEKFKVVRMPGGIKQKYVKTVFRACALLHNYFIDNAKTVIDLNQQVIVKSRLNSEGGDDQVSGVACRETFMECFKLQYFTGTWGLSLDQAVRINRNFHYE